MRNVFNSVQTRKIKRSFVPLHEDTVTTCDMGELIPIYAREMIPGDFNKISCNLFIRLQPMVAPCLTGIKAYTHFFYVPYRLLMSEEYGDASDWETFYTRGSDGDEAPELPKWTASLYDSENGRRSNQLTAYISGSSPDGTRNTGSIFGRGSLWDFFGNPLCNDFQDYGNMTSIKGQAYAYPLVFKKRAMNLIYNEYYRDETLQEEVNIDDNSLKLRNWRKDYFTSSLPFQQRGTTPSLNYEFDGHAVFDFGGEDLSTYFSLSSDHMTRRNIDIDGSPTRAYNFVDTSAEGNGIVGVETDTEPVGNSGYLYLGDDNDGNYGAKVSNFIAGTDESADYFTNHNRLSDDGKLSITAADLRLLFQIQKFMERSARGGIRYKEFLMSMYGVAPRDERLQRPEFIGGSKVPIVVSEVLQTSSTDNTTPQGNMAGHGITIDNSYIGKYHVSEPGLVIGLLSIMPDLEYMAQGFHREDLRRTTFDYFNPLFQNLSEQPVYKAELYYDGSKEEDIFKIDTENLLGYQGIYNEMRCGRKKVTNAMRDTFDYWTMARSFANKPSLNSNFIECIPRKDIFAVQDENTCIVNCHVHNKCLRPMTKNPEPGLIDHN